jgi:excisionase family DNA binding protein
MSFSLSSSSPSSSRPEETVAALGGGWPGGGDSGGEPDGGVLLYTPAQAAALLQVPESWLRRRVAARSVACSFLGKHLRFSRADLDAIVAAASISPADRPDNGCGRPRRRRSRSQ